MTQQDEGTSFVLWMTSDTFLASLSLYDMLRNQECNLRKSDAFVIQFV